MRMADKGGFEMTKVICQRWAIVDLRTKKEIGNLGWFTNSSKDDVLRYCSEKHIQINKGEDVKVVEEY